MTQEEVPQQDAPPEVLCRRVTPILLLKPLSVVPRKEVQPRPPTPRRHGPRRRGGEAARGRRCPPPGRDASARWHETGPAPSSTRTRARGCGFRANPATDSDAKAATF